MKALKSLYKAMSSFTNFVLIVGGIAMFITLVFSFLASSTVGLHHAIVHCDEDCYNDLELEDVLPYQDGLIVMVERTALRCSYYFLGGKRHDQLWQSEWKFDVDMSGGDGVVVETDMSWPINNASLTWDGMPIRSPENKNEVGCQPRYYGFNKNNDDRISKPVLVPH